jgi:hypothetical protein
MCVQQPREERADSVAVHIQISGQAPVSVPHGASTGSIQFREIPPSSTLLPGRCFMDAVTLVVAATAGMNVRRSLALKGDRSHHIVHRIKGSATDQHLVSRIRVIDRPVDPWSWQSPLYWSANLGDTPKCTLDSRG